ncbi:MAG TPA: metallophosphoesterase, partial [Patescibacteria group bacterium]|nr:metallophosphoesterase [Patescibacteria group bacterium]
LLGGDFLHEKAKDLPKLEPIEGFRAPLGVYAVLGNHDEYKASKEAHAWFAASSVPLLENRAVRAREDVAVAGADDDWYGETDLEAAFKDIPPDGLALVMLHNPDLAPHAAKLLKERAGTTVFFSGHAHGGQIRLPLIGPVPTLPHHLGRTYDRGVFAFGGISLVLGAGVGESGPRARLFCPPEIVLVTVRYKA